MCFESVDIWSSSIALSFKKLERNKKRTAKLVGNCIDKTISFRVFFSFYFWNYFWRVRKTVINRQFISHVVCLTIDPNNSSYRRCTKLKGRKENCEKTISTTNLSGQITPRTKSFFEHKRSSMKMFQRRFHINLALMLCISLLNGITFAHKGNLFTHSLTLLSLFYLI